MAEPTKAELEAKLEATEKEVARLKNQVSELQIDVHQATRQHQGYLYMERAEYRRLAASEEAARTATAEAEAHGHAHAAEGRDGEG